MKTTEIETVTGEPAIDIAIDTVRIGKQALVFVNTKRGAESTAEKISKKLDKNPELDLLADDILKANSSPTKQCRRLAKIVEKQAGFHHAGLSSKQRYLIEDAFIKGDLKVLCATPTLAAGVNVPAFRAIIRDLKRFTGAGMSEIPVLEYHQMAGRAGRPDFNDSFGEAIILAKNEKEAEKLTEQYIHGAPESIYSKVAAMPVLRTYCLSLVAGEHTKTRDELKAFFAETFFAHQYGDLKAVNTKVDQTIELLSDWGFIERPAVDDFVSAGELDDGSLKATRLGVRVSQLYIDPLTAHELLEALGRDKTTMLGYMHLICSAREMRPLLRVKVGDYEELEASLQEHEDELLKKAPSIYESEYETYLESYKTAQLFMKWCDEQTEEYLLENFNVRPGELRGRIDIADWLLYATAELSRICKQPAHISELAKARTRLKYGVREELLALLRLKNIGRVRARTLFRNNIKTLGDVKNIDFTTLSQIIGPAVAKDLKKQVGEEVDVNISKRKRIGQLSLENTRFQ